ncbi:MAG: hypothetical protein ACRC46_09765 [Thermoguttaceae bacterium]
MTTISHTLSPSPMFPVADDELVDDFADDAFVDDVEGDEIGAAFVRSRMIQNEDGEWVYNPTDEDRAAIERSERDFAEGRWYTHEEFMARMRAWRERND